MITYTKTKYGHPSTKALFYASTKEHAASKFDSVMMTTALNFASLSRDPDTRVGAVLSHDHRIIACGYNGTAKGSDNTMKFPDGSTKPDVIHAEMNAIIDCAKRGVIAKDAVLYCTYSPCYNCAASIIQAGIKTVYFLNFYEKHKRSVEFMYENNIVIYQMRIANES